MRPYQGNRTPGLDNRTNVTSVHDDLFRLHEIGRIAHLVEASDVVASACPQSAATRYEREIERAPVHEAGINRYEAVHDRDRELVRFRTIQEILERVAIPEKPEKATEMNVKSTFARIDV